MANRTRNFFTIGTRESLQKERPEWVWPRTTLRGFSKADNSTSLKHGMMCTTPDLSYDVPISSARPERDPTPMVVIEMATADRTSQIHLLMQSRLPPALLQHVIFAVRRRLTFDRLSVRAMLRKRIREHDAY